MSIRQAKKVFVGLSGGVDSSVSAALLKKAGYKVTGVFIKVWQPDFSHSPSTGSTTSMDSGASSPQAGSGQLQAACNWKDDRLDAMRVCARLGIPFKELNLTKEYKREIVDYMIREYKIGRTPNPDVMCNRFIKFGRFYDWALLNGADFVATGHYARIATTQKILNSKSKIPNPKLNAKRYTLKAGLDFTKDQSYFLWQIRKEQLPRILFPIGGFRKTRVRRLAKKFGLITADKKDSQGLCFVGKVDMKDFLRRCISEKPGKVVDRKGKEIGEHDGAFFLTLGERHGFRITAPGVASKPHYVIAKDAKRNTVTVAPKSATGSLLGSVRSAVLKECNWLRKPVSGRMYAARARYREKLQPSKCSEKRGNTADITFATPHLMAPGQSLVLYDGDTVVGGGIIS